ncbi:MAG: hypothetical protein ACEQSB_01340 [Undibacterium sp.]
MNPRLVVLVSLLVFAVLIAVGSFWCIAKWQATPVVHQNVMQKEKQARTKAQKDTLSYAEQLQMKASLEMLTFWQVREVFQSPSNPQVMFFILNENGNARIVKYDTSKIENYLHNQSIDYPAYIETVYDEVVGSENELRGVGFDGNKFVFVKTLSENSPGPCSSPWQYDGLNAIQIDGMTGMKQSYDMAKARLEAVAEEVAKCEKELVTPVPMGKINIGEVCQGALAYMTFADGASADAFVEDCKAGKHPEVIEQYKANLNLGDGAAI